MIEATIKQLIRHFGVDEVIGGFMNALLEVSKETEKDLKGNKALILMSTKEKPNAKDDETISAAAVIGSPQNLIELITSIMHRDANIKKLLMLSTQLYATVEIEEATGIDLSTLIKDAIDKTMEKYEREARNKSKDN